MVFFELFEALALGRALKRVKEMLGSIGWSDSPWPVLRQPSSEVVVWLDCCVRAAHKLPKKLALKVGRC